MPEYIGRETLMKLMQANFQQGSRDGCDHPMYPVAEETIMEAPTITPESLVVHGRWEFDGSGWVCSECEEYALYSREGVQVKSDRCPNCGARMDMEE